MVCVSLYEQVSPKLELRDAIGAAFSRDSGTKVYTNTADCPTSVDTRPRFADPVSSEECHHWLDDVTIGWMMDGYFLGVFLSFLLCTELFRKGGKMTPSPLTSAAAQAPPTRRCWGLQVVPGG